jgi:hypothetical protein
MNEASFMFIHGWVDDVTREGPENSSPSNQAGQGRLPISCSRRTTSPVRLGDEVSVAVERDRLGGRWFSGHTTGRPRTLLREVAGRPIQMSSSSRPACACLSRWDGAQCPPPCLPRCTGWSCAGCRMCVGVGQRRCRLLGGSGVLPLAVGA